MPHFSHVTGASYDNVYCWPSPHDTVLRNRLGIKDAAKLAACEANMAAAGLLELGLRPAAPPFDTSRIRAIHKAIFGNVYDWAGEFRTVVRPPRNCGPLPLVAAVVLR